MLKSLSIAAIALFGVVAGSMAAPTMAKEYVIVDYEDDMSMLRVLDRGSVASVKDAIKSGWVITMFQGPAIEDNVVRRRALFMYDCATP
ncbi:MAG: hypothetical protein JF615_17525, partial [Asticcacaulis sp.]|nr:hypothetical protein [Asticcacaulis sp.]